MEMVLKNKYQNFLGKFDYVIFGLRYNVDQQYSSAAILNITIQK